MTALPVGRGAGARRERRPKLAVGKSPSCDACQLSLLDCEDELIAIADRLEIAVFPEATRAVARGPYDVSLVEGPVTTPHDLERIQEIREQSKLLVAIGACATSGGIHALRNFGVNPGAGRIRMALVAGVDECVQAAQRIVAYASRPPSPASHP